MKALDDGTVRARLGELPGWSLEDGKLTRQFEFDDFVFRSMARVDNNRQMAFLAHDRHGGKIEGIATVMHECPHPSFA